MFEKLQKKWKVNGLQLFLVLSVFAIGGSATGYLGKLVMNRFSIEKGWLWTLVYIIVVTLLWPLTVLIVSIPFGQFSFFISYLRRIGNRMGFVKTKSEVGSQNSEFRIQNSGGGVQASNLKLRTQSSEFRIQNSGGGTQNPKLKTQNSPVNIAIFASGAGSNAKKIIDHFGTKLWPAKNSNEKQVAIVKLVVCNKPGAGVLKFAEDAGVPALLIEKEKFFRGNAYTDELKAAGIDFIVLAGFLWKVPQALIDAYRNKIINIHPALLPKYGGKGMYGSRVHETVIQDGEKESGITIHYVDEHYDNGDIIFQARVKIDDNDTPESLAEKVHHLEHNNYPRIIEQLLTAPNAS